MQVVALTVDKYRNGSYYEKAMNGVRYYDNGRGYAWYAPPTDESSAANALKKES